MVLCLIQYSFRQSFREWLSDGFSGSILGFSTRRRMIIIAFLPIFLEKYLLWSIHWKIPWEKRIFGWLFEHKFKKCLNEKQICVYLLKIVDILCLIGPCLKYRTGAHSELRPASLAKVQQFCSPCAVNHDLLPFGHPACPMQDSCQCHPSICCVYY